MLYAPSRNLWTPSRVVPLLRNLSLLQWEQGVRPWHQDPAWRPGRAWCPGLDTQRRMHALGIVFPGAAAVRREVTCGAAGPNVATPSSFWRLDEASGTRADTGGTGGNDLSPTNAPGNAAGQVGNALLLAKASAQSVSKVGPSGMALGTGVSWSAGGWVRPATLVAGDGYGIMARCNNTCSVGWDFFIGSAQWRVYVGTVSNGRQSLDHSGTAPATNTWFNWVVTFDATAHSLKVRINDATQSTLSTTSDVATSTGDFLIGTEVLDGSFFDGRLDASGWWGSLLSAANITALWNGGAGTEFYGGVWH